MSNQINTSEYNHTIMKNSSLYSVIIISLIVATLFLSVSLGISFSTFSSQQQQYSDNIKSSKILRESYDNLIAQFRRFVSTRDMAGLNAYFDELDSGRRDSAIQALSSETEGGSLLSNALSMANELTDVEIRAIALAAKAAGYDLSTLRKEIAEYPFTAEERAMSTIELSAEASQIAFGDEFGSAANAVDGIIDQYTSTLLVENADKIVSIKNNIVLHIIFIAICLLSLIVLAFIVFYSQKMQIIDPLILLQEQLEHNERLNDHIGIDEIRSIATAYNNQMEELKCVHSVEASYQRALITDSEAVYEVNVSKDLITKIIFESEAQPLSSLMTSVGMSVPCSFDAYTQAVRATLSDIDRTVFTSLSCRNMLKEYQEGTLSSFYDSQITLFGVAKKIRSIALYREDPKSKDIIAMILIKDYTPRVW